QPGGDQAGRLARRQLSELLAGWAGHYPRVPVEPLVVAEPELSYTLGRASRRGRLLIAASGQRGWFAELVRGVPGPGQSPVLLVPPVSFSVAAAGR
ncbi:hypothetical protein, partial [Actinoplanes philippinensis]|uniref:hypothetical protein n=1 Tax=Actinoplanes philippinensis TaxID=35752 RepID=UPI00346B8D98